MKKDGDGEEQPTSSYSNGKNQMDRGGSQRKMGIRFQCLNG